MTARPTSLDDEVGSLAKCLLSNRLYSTTYLEEGSDRAVEQRHDQCSDHLMTQGWNVIGVANCIDDIVRDICATAAQFTAHKIAVSRSETHCVAPITMLFAAFFNLPRRIIR